MTSVQRSHYLTNPELLLQARLLPLATGGRLPISSDIPEEIHEQFYSDVDPLYRIQTIEVNRLEAGRRTDIVLSGHSNAVKDLRITPVEHFVLFDGSRQCDRSVQVYRSMIQAHENPVFLAGRSLTTQQRQLASQVLGLAIDITATR